MIPLYISSCLFSTVVVHAYYRHVEIYHHMFLLLTMSSILFHTTHNEIIRRADKLLAHVAYILVIMDAPKTVATNTQWLMSFPIIAVCTWFGQSLLPEKKETLHLCLHLVGAVGMNVYLLVLY
jgi:hypothetical protein